MRRRSGPGLAAVLGLALVPALAASACASEDVELVVHDAGLGGRDGSAPIPGLLALRLDPGTLRIVDDGVAPGETGGFRAIGTFADGDRDVTDAVVWSIDAAPLAEIAAGAVTTRGIGGTSDVVARSGSLEARGTLVVILEQSIVVPGGPADGAALFPADTSGDELTDPGGPRIVYPSHETMFPRNLERVDHQWSADASLDVFEVRFDSDVAHLRFYTSSHDFQPDAAGWRAIADTHAGSSLVLTVRGLARAMPGRVFRSRNVQLYYSRAEVLGAIYYWSTSTQGVMRATLPSPSAAKFFTDPATADDTCCACHTVSRDGRRLAVGYDGERLREVTIPDRELRIPATADARGPDYGWGTFNPGATRLLYANRGALHMLDAETGAALFDVPLGASRFATQPDWSPDGRWVAVALSTRAPSNKSVQASSLARLAVNPDGTLGMPEVLVASTGPEDTIYFPSFAPDSRYIAFVRGSGASKDNESATLYLVPADGSTPPVSLGRLNQRVGDRDGAVDLGNTMPTWAPSTRPEVQFLAFSSLRDYGNVLVDAKRDQLWGVAIDTSRILGGDDPSYAAFWMPFQDSNEGNHRAFWALASEDMCPSTIELCDSLDNDCDGIVDEGCCTPTMEICGNHVDEDCDGAADEGCDCMPTEICDNALDDDCDGLTDTMDEDCAPI